jgi:ring-1,2-phenylacetyl-CoA epoxidase subunit PaaC
MLADTCLLWGHRLSEWCGHGPALEEDIALTNTALDMIGQSRVLFQLVASRRRDTTTEDSLAFFRDAEAFRNLLMAALPNGDYAHTIARSLLLSAWFVPVWEALAHSRDAAIAKLAGNAAKESRTQLRHASDWVIRFGDGTTESQARILAAFEALWPFVAELLGTVINGCDQSAISRHWYATVTQTLSAAGLTLPTPSTTEDNNQSRATAQASRAALLAEMQSVARAFPGATW